MQEASPEISPLSFLPARTVVKIQRSLTQRDQGAPLRPGMIATVRSHPDTMISGWLSDSMPCEKHTTVLPLHGILPAARAMSPPQGHAGRLKHAARVLPVAALPPRKHGSPARVSTKPSTRRDNTDPQAAAGTDTIDPLPCSLSGEPSPADAAPGAVNCARPTRQFTGTKGKQDTAALRHPLLSLRSRPERYTGSRHPEHGQRVSSCQPVSGH